MKLVKNKNMKGPPNRVTFQVSPEMTRLDVKNYLEKIYEVPVLSVRTKIVSGKTDYYRYNNAFNELYKEPDIKYAHVTLVSSALSSNFYLTRIFKNSHFICSPRRQSLNIRT